MKFQGLLKYTISDSSLLWVYLQTPSRGCRTGGNKLGARLARPELPEAIWEAVSELWQSALDRAEETLAKRRDAVEAQLKQAETEKNEILKTLRKQQQQLSESRESIEALRDQAREWEVQNEGLRDALDERAKALDQVEADLRQAKKTITTLEPQLAATTEAKANAETAAMEYRRRIADLETERQELGQALAASRQALENERTLHKQETRDTRERHQAQEDRWLQEVDGLRQEIKEKARAHTLLDKALTGEKAKTTGLNGQIGKLEGENQKLKQEVVQTREVSEDLVSQRAVLELSLTDTRKELAETKMTFEHLKQERADETEAQVGKIMELLNTRLRET